MTEFEPHQEENQPSSTADSAEHYLQRIRREAQSIRRERRRETIRSKVIAYSLAIAGLGLLGRITAGNNEIQVYASLATLATGVAGVITFRKKHP